MLGVEASGQVSIETPVWGGQDSSTRSFLMRQAPPSCKWETPNQTMSVTTPSAYCSLNSLLFTIENKKRRKTEWDTSMRQIQKAKVPNDVQGRHGCQSGLALLGLAKGTEDEEVSWTEGRGLIGVAQIGT